MNVVPEMKDSGIDLMFSALVRNKDLLQPEFPNVIILIKELIIASSEEILVNSY